MVSGHIFHDSGVSIGTEARAPLQRCWNNAKETRKMATGGKKQMPEIFLSKNPVISLLEG
jgi:hypothetical protein